MRSIVADYFLRGRGWGVGGPADGGKRLGTMEILGGWRRMFPAGLESALSKLLQNFLLRLKLSSFAR